MNATPIFCGHAHSDSDRERPLFEALEYGFTLIEADVYFREGDLLVGHDEENLRPERTLRANYLEPLLARVRANGGQVYGAPAEVFLVLDVKEDDPRVYEALKRQLPPYAEMLTSHEAFEKADRRAVTVLLSGERPLEALRCEPRGWIFLDGRLWDVPPEAGDAIRVPLVSADWGRGALADGVRELASKLHRSGQRLRFWAVPEEPAVWRTLFDLGVDVISVDDYAAFAQFLRAAAGSVK